MSFFKSIENKLEGLVEGGFGRAFKSSVQPVELAHKLAKEMGDHKTVGVSNVYVPNEFEVYLGADDYEHLTSFADSLKAELSNYVTAFAGREGWTLVAPPRIELFKDEDLRVGEFGIATRTVNAPAVEPTPAAVAVPPVVVPAVAAPGPMIDQTVLYDQPPKAQPRPAVSAALRGPAGVTQLREAVTLIGRSRRCDVVVEDPNVSRQHAEVRRQGDSYVLRDLGSTNGTRVNRREVKQATLQHGDRIEVGTTELRFESRS
jgi:Protein of unknown function (DUF3662)/FHA domain